MTRIRPQRPGWVQGYGHARGRASRKGVKPWLIGVVPLLLLCACQTVTVAPAPSAALAPDPIEDQLRMSARALVTTAVRDGWAPEESESLADILLHGRSSEGESLDAVDVYLARLGAEGAKARARLEQDVSGARGAAAQISDELTATLARAAISQAALAEDLRLVERAIIYLKRGETLFSAASVRIGAANAQDLEAPPAAAWELELLRAELKQLAEEVDRLADRVMQQQTAPKGAPQAAPLP